MLYAVSRHKISTLPGKPRVTAIHVMFCTKRRGLMFCVNFFICFVLFTFSGEPQLFDIFQCQYGKIPILRYLRAKCVFGVLYFIVYDTG